MECFLFELMNKCVKGFDRKKIFKRLELVRTNAHVEILYHGIARMAFQFCLKYTRATEFRKLCDKLRKHLEDICKLPAQVSHVSMSKPETQQLIWRLDCTNLIMPFKWNFGR